jgi:hypothetical protein
VSAPRKGVRSDEGNGGGEGRGAVTSDKAHSGPRPRKKFCAYCGKTDDCKFRKCGACRKVRYCSTECQNHHWREHKLQCQR